MAAALHVKAKSEWKNVEIPEKLLSSNNLEGLIEFQELTDYEIIKETLNLDAENETENGKKKNKKKRFKRSKIKKDVNSSEPDKNGSKQTWKIDTAEKDLKQNTPPIKEAEKPMSRKDRKKLAYQEHLKIKQSRVKGTGRMISVQNVVNIHNVEDDDGSFVVTNDSCTSDGKDVHVDKKQVKDSSKTNIAENKGKRKKQSVPDSATKKEVPSSPSKKVISGAAPSCVTKKDVTSSATKKENSEAAPSSVTKKEVPSSVARKRNSEAASSSVTKKEVPSSVTKKEVPSSVTKKINSEAAPSSAAKKDELGEPKIKKRKIQDASPISEMEGWKGLFVPAEVQKALKEQNFTAPTPIQAFSLPSAIRDRMDILGAAETGSGKTLAFGIPVVNAILKMKSAEAKHNSEMVAENESASSDEESETPRQNKKFYALILTPTRELAVQIKNHIEMITKYTDMKVVVIVGGMAQEKQKRLLKRHPEIVIATPGRLWDLYSEGDPHLAQIPEIPLLVIDEADRMVEKGHFEELSTILEIINNDEENKKRRQNFVFSATLTFVHVAPQWLTLKKQKKKVNSNMTSKDKVNALMEQVGMKEHPKIVDLTQKVGTAETLIEARIGCTADEKDIYLYYFLKHYPGRTLVFTNSKDCLRRLISILTLLGTKPLPLHADMHQKQRLKNLEKFTADPKGLLLATDVAARGLDIPNVQHVIHYQVPKTTENYIHRSGRTARASKEGLSIMLVGPDDAQNYRKIIKALNKDADLPLFPVEFEYVNSVKERVTLTRQIDKEEHSFLKRKHQNNWFYKAAQEADLCIDDEHLMNDLGDPVEQNDAKKKLNSLKWQLTAMLKQPLHMQHFSGKYPTMTGKLKMPGMLENMTDVDAVSAVKKAGSGSLKTKKSISQRSKKRFKNK